MAQLQGAQMGQNDRQFAGNLNNQMNLAQAQLGQSAAELNANLGFQGLQTRYQGNLQGGLANQQAYMDALRMGEQSRQFGAGLNEQQAQFGADLNYRTQMAQQQAMNDIIRNNLAATNQASQIWGQAGDFEGRGFDQGLALNQQLGNFGFQQYGMDQQAHNAAYQHWMAQQAYPMQYAQMQAGLLNPMMQTGTQYSNTYGLKPSIWSQIAGLAITGAGAASGFMPGK